MNQLDRALKDLKKVICEELKIPLIEEKLDRFDKFLGKFRNRIEEEFAFFWDNYNFLIVLGGIVVCIGLWAFWGICNG